MKHLQLKKLGACLKLRQRHHRKLSHLHLESFDLGSFLYHRENRS
jgi:hypothetical protein